MKNYRQEIILATFLLFFAVAFYFLYGFLLPFILGIILAFAVNPIISRIEKTVKKRVLANTVFLAVIAGVIVIFILFAGQFINRDFKRLGQSFTVLVSENQDNLDLAGQKVKEYIGGFYDFEKLEQELKTRIDSVNIGSGEMDMSQIDTESIEALFEELTTFLESNGSANTNEKPRFGFMFMLSSTIFYFVLILYQFNYFKDVRDRYFNSEVRSGVGVIIDDLDRSFVRYFQLRTKIILALSPIYFTTFIIMDMPGLILLFTMVFLLSYIPYLQYVVLLPLALGCLVVSVEGGQSFLILFGIIVGVFVLASIIEELVLNPWIMERNIGLNPVIMILALAIWSYLLGLPGLLIGIPMTSLMLIYFKRYFLSTYLDE